MAITSYSTPSDAGMPFVILAYMAMSISIIKELFRSLLHFIGIHIESSEELSVESSECRQSPSESYNEEFRNQIPARRYGSIVVSGCLKQECSICLTEFEPNSEVNHLSCSHVFHKLCLEKWLNYWNKTCPLCRNHMMPQEAEEDMCPM